VFVCTHCHTELQAEDVITHNPACDDKRAAKLEGLFCGLPGPVRARFIRFIEDKDYCRWCGWDHGKHKPGELCDQERES
jgi:hypothetical protein